MTSNDKQYYIYLRASRQKVSVTKAQFDEYYRDINAFRRTQQNHGRCVCPPSKWLQCDMECHNCPYRTVGDTSSLDCGLTDEDGNEMNWLDLLQEELPDLHTPPLDDYVADAIDISQILSRLCEIMPQAIKIGRLRLQGLTENAIAARLGTSRQAYAYHLKKAAEALKKEFPDFF